MFGLLLKCAGEADEMKLQVSRDVFVGGEEGEGDLRHVDTCDVHGMTVAAVLMSFSCLPEWSLWGFLISPHPHVAAEGVEQAEVSFLLT